MLCEGGPGDSSRSFLMSPRGVASGSLGRVGGVNKGRNIERRQHFTKQKYGRLVFCTNITKTTFAIKLLANIQPGKV